MGTVETEAGRTRLSTLVCSLFHCRRRADLLRRAWCCHRRAIELRRLSARRLCDYRYTNDPRDLNLAHRWAYGVRTMQRYRDELLAELRAITPKR